LKLKIIGVIKPPIIGNKLYKLGACCLEEYNQIDANKYKVKIISSIRDETNRSELIPIKFDLDLHNKIIQSIAINTTPIISLGKIGTFDRDGMTYPWILKDEDLTYLFYTGWKRTTETRFENNLGLLKKEDASWVRVSKAPILPLDNDNYLGTGSVSVYKEIDESMEMRFRMLFTSFRKWAIKEDKVSHRYNIREITSDNITTWNNKSRLLISNKIGYESICRPIIHKEKIIFSCRNDDHYELFFAAHIPNASITESTKIHLIETENNEFQGFKSKEYLYAFDIGVQSIFLFNGDGYGATGIAVAILI